MSAAHLLHVRHVAGPLRRWAAPHRSRSLRWGQSLGLGLAAGPLLWPFPGDIAAATTEVLPAPDFSERPAEEPRSFATLPARTGIPYPPKPEPTFYRLEGPRDRPVARVIRLSDPEPAGVRRTRYVHAETGALLLTVPGR